MERRWSNGGVLVLVHLLFKYTGFACGLATNLRNETNKISPKDIIIGHKACIPQPTGACPAPRL